MAQSMRPWTKIHNAVTATAETSDVIDCRGWNALAVYIASTATDKNWTYSVLGAMAPTDNFVQCYDNAGAAMSKQIAGSAMFMFHNVPDYVMVKAAEDADGATVSVWAAPCNV